MGKLRCLMWGCVRFKAGSLKSRSHNVMHCIAPININLFSSQTKISFHLPPGKYFQWDLTITWKILPLLDITVRYCSHNKTLVFPKLLLLNTFPSGRLQFATATGQGKLFFFVFFCFFLRKPSWYIDPRRTKKKKKKKKT